VTVFDTGEDAGQPFLVMELLPGRTLADEIRAGRLPVARAVDIACAVLSALSAAHAEGIVHRDVKPGNVLLTADDVPKVADFGIAKTAGESATTGTLTGELLATPAYLAPERLAGEPAAPASDIYAVGVLLYEALAGRLPYAADAPAALLRAIADGRAEPLADVRRDTPSHVVAVVERAMARDPSQRFASADEMAAALDRFAVAPGEPDSTIIARATEPRTVPTRTTARGASDGQTRVLPSPAIAPPRRRRDARRRDARRPERRATKKHARRARAIRGWIAIAIAVVLLTTVAVVLATRDDDTTLLPGGPAAEPATSVLSAPSGSSGASPLPAPLDRAIDRLEQVTR